jgi:3-phenylpropionate/trans-cinnamate dioxygenase ferredoxin reductase subunit
VQKQPPYQRPPLSKKYLLGEMALERLFLKPEAFYAENDIDLRTGSHVTKVDATSKSVEIGEDVLSYDQLVFTTGSSPRYLPAAVGGTLEGVHVVRGLSDVDAMATEFTAESHVLIIGGG